MFDYFKIVDNFFPGSVPSPKPPRTPTGRHAPRSRELTFDKDAHTVRSACRASWGRVDEWSSRSGREKLSTGHGGTVADVPVRMA